MPLLSVALFARTASTTTRLCAQAPQQCLHTMHHRASYGHNKQFETSAPHAPADGRCMHANLRRQIIKANFRKWNTKCILKQADSLTDSSRQLGWWLLPQLSSCSNPSSYWYVWTIQGFVFFLAQSWAFHARMSITFFRPFGRASLLKCRSFVATRSLRGSLHISHFNGV